MGVGLAPSPVGAGEHRLDGVGVHDELVGIGRRRLLAEVDLPLAGPQEDDGELHGGVRRVPLEVAEPRRRWPTRSGRRRRRAGGSRASHRSRTPSEKSSNTRWAYASQHTSSSRGPRQAISQSRTPTGAKSRYMQLPMRESPQDTTASPSRSGNRSSSQARQRSMTEERWSVPAHQRYHAVVRARCRRSGVAPLAGSSARKAKRSSSPGSRCSSASTSTVASWSRRWSVGGGVVEPAVAEVVGHHVGRHEPVDPLHDEERGAEHRAVGLVPPHRRHRHRRELADEPEHAELALEVVAREHRHVVGVGCQPGDQPARAARAVLVPRRVEEQRLARHAVGRGALDRRDRRPAPRGGSVRRSHASSPARSRAGSLLERCISVAGSTVPPTRRGVSSSRTLRDVERRPDQRQQRSLEQLEQRVALDPDPVALEPRRHRVLDETDPPPDGERISGGPSGW